MSTLVSAIKDYSYMDQADLQEVDVHDGPRGDAHDPRPQAQAHADRGRRDATATASRAICVYGSELNQVWTNLLDNAIDALGEQGTITVATAPWRGDGVEVRDRRRRAGHPRGRPAPHLRPVLHDEGVGAGTGLGLDTARRIVHDRHDGDLAVASRPGQTTFTVRLPRAPRKA